LKDILPYLILKRNTRNQNQQIFKNSKESHDTYMYHSDDIRTKAYILHRPHFQKGTMPTQSINPKPTSKGDNAHSKSRP
jgi:hypothetical protein